MKLLNNTQSGRSMVEMLGVLAIIGVLSVGGIAGYSKAMHKHKLNKTFDIISTVIVNMTELLSRSNGSEFNTSDAIQAGVFEGLNCANDYCELPIGYNIYANSSAIEIDISGSDKSAHTNFCIEFLSQHWENVLPSHYNRIAAVTHKGVPTYLYAPKGAYVNGSGEEMITSYGIADIQEACDASCNKYAYCGIYIDSSE
jgi:Tfp pilus assembly protein PilE